MLRARGPWCLWETKCHGYVHDLSTTNISESWGLNAGNSFRTIQRIISYKRIRSNEITKTVHYLLEKILRRSAGCNQGMIWRQIVLPSLQCFQSSVSPLGWLNIYSNYQILGYIFLPFSEMSIVKYPKLLTLIHTRPRFSKIVADWWLAPAPLSFNSRIQHMIGE